MKQYFKPHEILTKKEPADLGMVYALASYAAGSDEYKKEYLSLVRNYGEKQPGFSEEIVE